ncbi:uncharacterized protein PG998_004300 [Apiospora kogelbergensis]|uniref:uncharacterized protein n=1 Tax=Apiospora kogelbergensis TaxID=1337665 RepID=UPI0031302061
MVASARALSPSSVSAAPRTVPLPRLKRLPMWPDQEPGEGVSQAFLPDVSCPARSLFLCLLCPMEDRSEQVLAIAVTFMVVCWATVGLRVHCRLHVVKSFGRDDLVLVILQLLGWQHGTGRRESRLSEANKSKALMFWFICELLYIVCTCLLKLAAGQFLLRLAVDARHVWALRALMLSTALFGTAYFVMVLFQCQPPSVFWTASPRAPGRCWGDTVVLALTYAASAVNCLADWCFGLMPVLVVRTLHMPRGTKVLVACLMSFAAIASIATMVRMAYIPTLINGEDFLFETTDVAIWSSVEVGIGIAALSPGGAAPPAHPLAAPPARPARQRRQRLDVAPLLLCPRGDAAEEEDEKPAVPRAAASQIHARQQPAGPAPPPPTAARPPEAPPRGVHHAHVERLGPVARRPGAALQPLRPHELDGGGRRRRRRRREEPQPQQQQPEPKLLPRPGPRVVDDGAGGLGEQQWRRRRWGWHHQDDRGVAVAAPAGLAAAPGRGVVEQGAGGE